MDKKILKFINRNHVSVLTTLLENGNPHSASMHYASRENPLEFVFFTKKNSRKCKHFENNKKYPASLVIGFDEKEMIEFQSNGMIRKTNKEESKQGVKTFVGKFKGAELDNEHQVLIYEPTWWRYTEFKPKFKVIESKRTKTV